MDANSNDFKIQLKNYLETLSRENLIDILIKLSAEHPEIYDVLIKIIFENKKGSIDSIEESKSEKLESDHSVSTTHQNSVTRKSSTQEKINLYKSIFIGRDDVFALRWYNAKSGKSGYSPVCANKWIQGKCDLKKSSCSTCPFKSPIQLNDTYFFNHLAGKDEFCRDVIGLYPLMAGNVCRFLAIDFDAHKPKTQTSADSTEYKNDFWKSDILAVHKTCYEYKIPSYIEISRSGNGGHLWFFFSENISARLARNFGTAILKLSMQKRHSISFETFDRMFPNQDEIPKGGFGNLIALPLQGKAVREGHSVFVDENFIPFQDQWQVLNSIQKLDEQIINITLRKINEQILDFVEKDDEDMSKKTEHFNLSADKQKQHDESFQKSDFPSIVQIILSNCVEISKSGISEQALGILHRTAVFTNPEYYKNLRMHLPLYNIPHFIDCSKENENHLLLPRGNLDYVLSIISNAGAAYKITDNRETGISIDVQCKIELYEEQKDALGKMMKSDIGILSAGTGFGKTIVASALIAERKINTLILVQSHALLEQWKKSIKNNLGISPGTIASGKDKSTGIIDVAIVKSLVETQSDEVKLRSHKYGMLIVDEAHHVSAFTTENLVSSFKAKYVYGLTATPIRRDGHQKIIFYQCGKILYSTTSRQMNESQNFEHYFIPRFTSFHYMPEDNDSSPVKINKLYEMLVQNDARNTLIAEDVKSAVEKGKTPLILSERIEHLELLYENLKSFAKNVILITGKGTAKQKRGQLEKLNEIPASESLIILATGKYAGEGFDYPRIDTLFLGMPFSWKGTLSQYCGRLHRNFFGKEEVVIYDYVDFRLPVFDRMYQNRLKGYKQLGYSVKPKENENTEILPENKTSRLYSKEDYLSDFENDIANAKSTIVITAPYLSKYEVQKFLLAANKKINEGCKIQILIKNPIDEAKSKKTLPLISLIEQTGINIKSRDNISQKIMTIDEKILWYGNINFLGYTEPEECCMRIANDKIASEIEGIIFQ